MHIVLQIVTAARALEKEGKRIFSPHGLTPVQFNVLNLLSKHPAGMRASDLARALIVDPSNVTGLLKRMKHEGLLNEIENTADRRQHVVTWSAKGQAAWKPAHRDYERSLVALDSVLTPVSRKGAENALKQLTEALILGK
jgi:DNA-binding MarR family transcriptional regulator